MLGRMFATPSGIRLAGKCSKRRAWPQAAAARRALSRNARLRFTKTAGGACAAWPLSLRHCASPKPLTQLARLAQTEKPRSGMVQSPPESCSHDCRSPEVIQAKATSCGPRGPWAKCECGIFTAHGLAFGVEAACGICYMLGHQVRLFLGSSVVEQAAVNRSVAGSNPARGANISTELFPGGHFGGTNRIKSAICIALAVFRHPRRLRDPITQSARVPLSCRDRICADFKRGAAEYRGCRETINRHRQQAVANKIGLALSAKARRIRRKPGDPRRLNRPRRSAPWSASQIPISRARRAASRDIDHGQLNRPLRRPPPMMAVSCEAHSLTRAIDILMVRPEFSWCALNW